jgi:Fe-Mn family superoxide dismutase
MERRKFITVFGTAALATPLIGTLNSMASETKAFDGYKFPELGFAYNALEPYIDAQTMEIHYTKHHKAYFNNFMTAAEGTDLLKTPMEQIFAGISKQPVAIRNNGGGFYNHSLFWENMSPAKNEIPANLKASIEKDFGTFDAFKEAFGKAAKTRFGSGWAWLSVDKGGKLFVSSTPNQDNPLMDVVEEKGTPLLCLDVWEHAYYLHYQNRRPEYVDNFWNIVNWDVVNNRLKAANSK